MQENIKQIIKLLFIFLYLYPLLIMILYVWLQKLEDIFHRQNKNKAFKDGRAFIICLGACFVPIANIVMSFIAFKLFFKSFRR